MKLQAKVFGTLVAASLLVACGGGGVSSGVDGSKPAETVTDAEAKDVCEATVQYQADQANSISTGDACKFAGALAGAIAGNDKALCEQTVTTCNEQADTATDTEDEPNTSACSSVTAGVVAGCTVTVGEIEECLTEVIDAYIDGIKSAPTCDELGATTDGGDGSSDSSSACDAVAADPECAVVLGLADGF